MSKKFIIALLIFFQSAICHSYTKVEIESISGFGVPALARIKKVVGNIEKVINSESFKEKIISHTYKSQKIFFDMKTETNEQIYSKLMSGAVTLDKSLDNTWKYNLILKKIFSRSVTSYTMANIKTIYVSASYFKLSSDSQLARTLCHEYTHKAGYGHTMKWTPDRPFTVPYGTGEICGEVYKTLFP